MDEAQALLDAGRPFHAHEVFEDAWKAANGDHTDMWAAGLWKALAQLAVGMTHRLRGNPVGADRLLRRAAAGLRPYEDARPFGLDITAIRAWALNPAPGSPPRLR